VVEWLLEQEDRMGLHTPRPFRQFEERVFEHRANLQRLIRALNADGRRIVGYGASTKGNCRPTRWSYRWCAVPSMRGPTPSVAGRVGPASWTAERHGRRATINPWRGGRP
jgi:C-methyltransferase C-terminal domain